jgi:hypothetical protein
VIIALLTTSTSTMAIDLASLWDFNKPDVSEQRFRDALATTTGDDALILQTQIARTYGLRKEFSKAQDLLSSIEKNVTGAGPQARARYALELGRTYASAAHPPELQTVEAKERAKWRRQFGTTSGLDHRIPVPHASPLGITSARSAASTRFTASGSHRTTWGSTSSASKGSTRQASWFGRRWAPQCHRSQSLRIQLLGTGLAAM